MIPSISPRSAACGVHAPEIRLRYISWLGYTCLPLRSTHKHGAVVCNILADHIREFKQTFVPFIGNVIKYFVSCLVHAFLVGMCCGKVKNGQGLQNELPVERENAGLRNELENAGLRNAERA